MYVNYIFYILTYSLIGKGILLRKFYVRNIVSLYNCLGPHTRESKDTHNFVHF